MREAVIYKKINLIFWDRNCGTEGYLYYFDDVVNQYHYVPDEQYDFFMDFYCTFGVCTCRAFYENQPPYLNLKKISRHFGLRVSQHWKLSPTPIACNSTKVHCNGFAFSFFVSVEKSTKVIITWMDDCLSLAGIRLDSQMKWVIFFKNELPR